MKRKQMDQIEQMEQIEQMDQRVLITEEEINENLLNIQRKRRFEELFEMLFKEQYLLNIVYSFTGLEKQSIEYLIEEKKAYFVEKILSELKGLFVETELIKFILDLMGYDTKMYGCYRFTDIPDCDDCYLGAKELAGLTFSVNPFKITDDIPPARWLLHNGVGITNDTYYHHHPFQIIQPQQIMNQNDTNLYYNSEVCICIACDRHYHGINIIVIFTENLY